MTPQWVRVDPQNVHRMTCKCTAVDRFMRRDAGGTTHSARRETMGETMWFLQRGSRSKRSVFHRGAARALKQVRDSRNSPPAFFAEVHAAILPKAARTCVSFAREFLLPASPESPPQRSLSLRRA